MTCIRKHTRAFLHNSKVHARILLHFMLYISLKTYLRACLSANSRSDACGGADGNHSMLDICTSLAWSCRSVSTCVVTSHEPAGTVTSVERNGSSFAASLDIRVFLCFDAQCHVSYSMAANTSRPLLSRCRYTERQVYCIMPADSGNRPKAHGSY